MKVAWIVRSAEGGILNHLSQLMQGLQEAELCIVGPESLREWAGERRFIAIPLEDGLSWRRDIGAIRALYKILRDEKPEIVHIHGLKAALLGVPACRLAGGSRLLFTAHNSLPAYPSLFGRMGQRVVQRFLFRSIDYIISVSDAVREQIVEHVPEYKVVTIRNGIVPARFQGHSRMEARQAVQIEAGDLVVGTVARLITAKGISTLIEAASLITRILPKVKIIIVGDGPEREKFQEYSNRLGLSARVVFAGWRDDVPSLMAGWDVFVLPSYAEGFNLSVLEAMASRLPVVVSDLPCMREALIHGKSGYVVPPKDAPALAAAMLNILRDLPRARAMGDFNFNRAHQMFGSDRMVESTRALYEETLTRGRF